MEYMICAKFHAMVLSSIAGQKIYIMSYSQKITNVIDDLQLKIPTIDLNNLDKPIKISLDDFRSVEDKILNTIKIEAEDQELAIKNSLNI